jgi:elongation factor Ts
MTREPRGMAITSQMVRDLRDRTGAGMMECKKALEATRGDMRAAEDHLRMQGLKASAKKAERSTAEGRVFAVGSRDGRRGHLVGVACETDFLAKSDRFRALVADLEKHVESQDPSGLDAGLRPILSQRMGGEGPPVSQVLQEIVGVFGENTRIARCTRLENPKGQVGTYVHHDHKQGAIVSVTTSEGPKKAAEVLKSLCQHIVVFRPAYANRGDVPASEVERERKVILASEDMKSKPEAVREKMVAGRMNSFYAQQVLAEQPWILDDKLSVQKALERVLGADARIESFERVHLGT